MPEELLPAVEVVSAAVLVQRKQYKVFDDRFELGNVTVCEETEVAVPIPGHAVAPDGISLVETVQLEVLPTANPVGKTTWISTSVPLSDNGVCEQISPVVAVVAFALSGRTYTCENVPA